MNKKSLIIVAAVLLIIAVGWGVMSSNKTSDTQNVKTNNGNSISTNSFKDILTGGTSQSCTYESQGSKGSVYVSGGKVRGDFDVTVGEQTTKSHMIVMDSTSYIWTDGQASGFKMAFDPNAEVPEAENSTTTTNNFDPRTTNNYKCTSWISDNSKFTLPTNVTFTEFTIPSQSTEVVPNTTGAGSASQCSYCNALTGDEKTQCLTALKCN